MVLKTFNLKRKRNYKSRLWIQAEFLIPPHPLTNFETRKCYQNKPSFNGVYPRKNLPNKIKDEASVINLDEYSDIETHWIALYELNNNVTYFNSFGLDHIPKEVEKLIVYKIMKVNIFRI